MDEKPATVIIMGRSLADYILRDQMPAPDFTIAQCAGCATPVALSPEGAAKLAEHPLALRGVLCNPCAVKLMPDNSNMVMMKTAADQAERSETARQGLREMLKKARL